VHDGIAFITDKQINFIYHVSPSFNKSSQRLALPALGLVTAKPSKQEKPTA
jgi:hypothetical protein